MFEFSGITGLTRLLPKFNYLCLRSSFSVPPSHRYLIILICPSPDLIFYACTLTNSRCLTGEIGKLLGAKWKELDDSEKKPYLEQAARDKARAEQEKSEYDVRIILSASSIPLPQYVFWLNSIRLFSIMTNTNAYSLQGKKGGDSGSGDGDEDDD